MLGKNNYKFFFTILLLSIISINNTISLEKRQIFDTEERQKKLESLNWHNWDNAKTHVTEIPLANANVQIFEDEVYLKGNKDINQYYWWKFGEPVNEDTVLLIAGKGYGIYVHYRPEGFVKLDDWKNIKASDLLADLRKNAKSMEEYNKQNNVSYAKEFEWIFDPELNEENRSVSYSYKVLWSDNKNSLESKNIILGKKGYLETAYVVNLDDNYVNLNEEAAFAKDFINGVAFEDGYKHSDYKKGDKIAAAGVGTVVAGSLGAKAIAKTGFFAKLIPFLAKFWWIILAPLAAFGFTQKEKIKSKVKRNSRRKK